MATEKLYYQDAHQAQFQATVLSCRPGKHGYDVVLDRTCFYPEGGGQPGDTGVLSGVRVTDTHEAGGEIVHYCEAPLAEGQTVEGAIDYDRRFEFMQLHTGEHILSGVIHRRFGYENVGFHMGADFVTIDLSGMLTPEQVQSVEAEANDAAHDDCHAQQEGDQCTRKGRLALRADGLFSLVSVFAHSITPPFRKAAYCTIPLYSFYEIVQTALFLLLSLS